MKNAIPLLFILLLPAMVWGQTVTEPDYEYRVSSLYTIRSIERTDECTRLNIRATFRPDWWFDFSADNALVDSRDAQQRFMPHDIVGLQFGERRFMGPEGVHDFTVVYPPIPRDVERVDLIDDGEVIFKGISLTHSRVDAFADQREQWMDAHPETPMDEMERLGQPLAPADLLRCGKATLRGQIGHYNAGTRLRLYATATDMFLDANNGSMTAIADDGTFEITADVTGPANIELCFIFPTQGSGGYRNVYVEPGQTLDIFIDWEDDILACDRQRGLLPWVPAVVRGPLAEVNRQMADAPTISHWELKQERDLQANVESMMRHHHADMPAIKAWLRRGDLLPKARLLVETEAKMKLALMRFTLPYMHILRIELDGQDGRGFLQCQMRGHAKDVDASYYDFMRDIDLDDATLFHTPSGSRFLHEYGHRESDFFNTVAGCTSPGREGNVDSLLERSSRFLGYDHLPLADQLVLVASRKRDWNTLTHSVENGLTTDDVGLEELERMEQGLQDTMVERHLSHPALKAFNDRIANETKTMIDVIRARPSVRAEWMRLHPDTPKEEQLEAMLADYDPDTFFTIGRARVNGTIGRYDTARPHMVYADMTGCGGRQIEGIEVAADGTFAIDEEVTNPGVIMLMVHEPGTFSPHNRIHLYVEPNSTLDIYIDFHDLTETGNVHQLAPEPTVHGTLGMMSALLRTAIPDDCYMPDLSRPMAEVVADMRAKYMADAEQIVDFYPTGKLKRLLDSERQMLLPSRLVDLPMQKDWRENQDKVMEWKTMLNRQMKMVDANYYGFLRDLPADDITLVAAPSASRLLSALAYGCGAGSDLFDCVLAGACVETISEEVLKRRLAFYGGDTLPLFEQAGIVRTLRADPEAAAKCRDFVLKYITNSNLRKVLMVNE